MTMRMANPGLNTALTTAIETLINTALRYDPASRQQLAQVHDVLAVESTAPEITLYFQGIEDGVRVMSYCEQPVATHLKGSPLALLSLLKQPTSLANSGVELAGSVSLLQQWQTILQQLDIDWEDAISGILGDIAGPMMANTLRSGFSWAKAQKIEQQRLLKEYLTEELSIIPSKTELNNFYRDVGALSLDVDRISARIQQLKETMNSSQKHSNTTQENKEKNE